MESDNSKVGYLVGAAWCKLPKVRRGPLFNKGIVQFYDLDLKNEAVETWKTLASLDPNFKMPTGELIIDFLGTLK